MEHIRSINTNKTMENKLKMKAILDNLTSVLDIKRNIVGIKYIKDKSSFDAACGKKPYNKMTYCVMVKVAMADVALKINLDNIGCRGAINVLGLTKPAESFLSGESGNRLGLYCDLDTAKIAANNLTRCDNKYYGLQIMPLKDFTEDPDVVIIVSSPYNIMRIIQGYGYKYGIKKACSVSGNQAFCSELTAEPMMNDEMNFSMFCSGTRFWCGWGKDEMGVGIPYKYFNDIVDGVMATLNPTEPISDKLRIIDRLEERNIEYPVDTGKSYYYKYKK